MTKDEDVSTQRSDAEIPLAGIIRYNPLHDMSTEERVKATARRVGLDTPVKDSDGRDQ